METLGPPVTHHLNAASGWLELGAIHEAERELRLVPPDLKDHPETLLVRWELAACKKEWGEARALAAALVQRVPERSEGWIKEAYALHELKQTTEAHDLLIEVHPRFPQISVIPYNLACYCAQLGNLSAAVSWIQEAVKIGGVKEIIGMALKDEDLRPLWSQLEKVRFD